MAIKVKGADVSAKKYVARASVAGPDYSSGIQNPKQDQASAAIAAAPTWAAAVSQAAANGSFAKGIQRNPGKWAANSLSKGAQRYGPGVSQALSTYQNAIAPYLQVLSNLTLPPRAVKGDPSNLNRVAAVDQALRQHKLTGA